MAITHVFFIITDQDFRFEDGAIIRLVARSRRHLGQSYRPALSARLIRQRKLKRHSILRAHNFRNVAFARRVFDKVDVPRSHGYLFPSRNFDLSMAAQRDHVLPARRTMPVVDAAARCPMELALVIAIILETSAGLPGVNFSSTSSA
jgi:hypothetical protein